jgi:hypothetical protein
VAEVELNHGQVVKEKIARRGATPSLFQGGRFSQPCRDSRHAVFVKHSARIVFTPYRSM